ncbi:MAG: DUF2703 domain-containing protein [Armatimonadota bacterium]|nr:DUF2703 domain-containing protein [Armatimonadota bacterium]MDR7421971.1 DUF2703 domain-containing protein [Armatimonadota bacterium]MDR7453493.1 DUF2703 domain-containing protein [Armatimonadota bacterium]MDR7456958.1 DUF2703 domain-containing protein [Armatimonadota bacterium]MDR7496481.1 DUF2703 domain-containing protein [Armatimonadota bacterium]
MRIEFLYWEECPSHPEALARLRGVLGEEGLPGDIEVIRVETEEDARRHAFPGSPTIRIDGVDLQPEGVQGGALLTCRTYRTEAGRLSPLPTVTMIRRALQAARRRTSDPGGMP